MKNPHEPNAPLYQATSRQTRLAERPRHFLVESIKFLGRLALFFVAHYVRDRRLHTESKFVGLDTSL